MAFEFTLPDVAEGLVEAKLVSWKVKEGDVVQADQPLCEVETDKSVVELPSPRAGKISKLHASPGTMVKVGAVLVTFDDNSGPASVASAPSAAPVSPPSAPPAPAPVVSPASPSPAPQADSSSPSGNSIILPKDRKLAADLGVDISLLKGTGSGGRITEEDVRAASKGTVVKKVAVEQAAADEVKVFDWRENFEIDKITATLTKKTQPSVSEAVKAPVSQPTPTSSSATAPAPVPAREGDKRIKIESVRAAIKRKMEQSWKTPQATLAMDVNVDALIAERNKVKEEMKAKGIKLTYLAYIAKAVAAALEKFPYFNANVDDASNEIVVKKDINVGIATDTEHGLMVPNIKGCNTKRISEIAKDIQVLAGLARERKLGPKEMSQGTFTITNVGSFGGTGGTAILNYPETAILTVCNIREEVHMVEGKQVVKSLMPLLVTFDHRIIDGADAGRFLNFLNENLSNPALMLNGVL